MTYSTIEGMIRQSTNNPPVDDDGVGLDEGLDAQDVAAAMYQRAEEEHISSGIVQSAYYDAWAGLQLIKNAAKDLKNERMERDAIEALNYINHIHTELESKYQWD